MSYLNLFKNDARELPKDIYDLLNNLFSDVDAYCGDPALQDEDDLSAEELFSSAKETLKKLS